jgi:hypothetical protein
VVEVSHFHESADKTLSKPSRLGTCSRPFETISEQRDGVPHPNVRQFHRYRQGDKSLLSKQILSNPLVLMMALNLARLGLVLLQGKIEEIRRRRQRALPASEEGAALRRELDEIANKIEESSRLVDEESDFAGQLKEIEETIRNLKSEITDTSNASKVNEKISQLIECLDVMLNSVAPSTTTSDQPPEEELQTTFKAFLLLKAWLE